MLRLDKLSCDPYYIDTRYIVSRCRMTRFHQDPESLKPLSPAVFHILLALADDERHGYGIMQEVKFRTDGQVSLAPGTLYGAIKRLLERGHIEEADERADPSLDDERRRYYKLTEIGKRVLWAETTRLEGLVHQAQAKQVLQDPKLSPRAGGE